MKKPVMRYRTNRREFAEAVREHAGTDQNGADQMIDGVLGSIRAWILNAVEGLDENSEARLLVSGFGSFRVSVLRRGRRNPQRLAAGLVNPVPVTVRVEFHPCEVVREAIREANRALNREPTGAILRKASSNPSEAVGRNAAVPTH